MLERISKRLAVLSLAVVVAAIGVSTADAQAKKRRRKPASPVVKTVQTPATTGDASVVSRADDFSDLLAVPVASPTPKPGEDVDVDPTTRSLDDLRTRIKALERVGKSDPDAKQKRLSLSLDIVTRAEQRADTLRKQLFEMIEKENTISGRMDSIDFEMRPEAIDRQVSMAGSLRPEELRAIKRKSLELEKVNLQALLTEVRRNKASIEQNLQKADALVERLRSRLEKEIDTALADDSDKPE